MINASDFRKGITFEINGEPHLVLDFQHVKPGKGAAFVRTKYKNILTGATREEAFNPDDKFPKAHIETKKMQYLYNDGELYYFMDMESYEQIQVTEDQIGSGVKYLKENMIVQILLHETKIIGVDIPSHVELEVVDTPPAEKGNTAQGGTKPATLETGAVVNVPFFVSNGDVIRVDTRSNEYLDRV